MAFNPNIPQAIDYQDDSQPQFLANNQQLDTSFGIDHYKFSDLTANNGFHNRVTTPAFVDNPATGLPPVTTTSPIFYALQQTANLGVLQYSRGPNDAVPTPITNLKSPSTPIIFLPNSTINVLDFTGISIASFYFIAFDSNTRNSNILYYGFYSSSLVNKFSISRINIGSFSLITSGDILILKNSNPITFSNLYWELQFIRIQ